jgi:hypothetical protein
VEKADIYNAAIAAFAASVQPKAQNVDQGPRANASQ